jgi:hypothetical protein
LAHEREPPFIAILAGMHRAPPEAGAERQQSPADLPKRRALETIRPDIVSGRPSEL